MKNKQNNKENLPKKILLIYEADELEFPLDVFDTITECAKFLGATRQTIFKYIQKQKPFKYLNKIAKIEWVELL